MTAPLTLAEIVAEGERLLAAMGRDARGFPSPLPWYVHGDHNMIWADDGDALVSYADGTKPYFERPVADLVVFAVNELPRLLAVARAAMEMRGHIVVAPGPMGRRRAGHAAVAAFDAAVGGAR